MPSSVCEAELFAPFVSAVEMHRENYSQQDRWRGESIRDVQCEMQYEQRCAIFGLLSEALHDEPRWCDVLQGMLLPPPWAMKRDSGEYAGEDERLGADMSDSDGEHAGKHAADDDVQLCHSQVLERHRNAVRRLASELPHAWRETVVLMPFHLALHAGVYDARLRVAMRRLCRLLSVSFDVILQKEAQVSALDVEDVDEKAKRDDMKGALTSRKQQRRFSAQRIAAVGAFAAVGGAALVLTGGLAAPVIGPAFAALVGAATTTLGVVSTVGSAILGGGALAAAFAALIGIATHAAAAAVLLTPYLTAGNLTALFGVSGVGLAGYKGIRRTGESSLFIVRGIDEIEDLPPLHNGTLEDAEALMNANDKSSSRDAADEEVRESKPPEGGLLSRVGPLSKVSQMVQETHSQQVSDYSDDIFSRSLCGLVVPNYTVNVTLRNIVKSDTLEKRSRSNIVAVENHLPGISMELRGLKLSYGVWAHVPPRCVPPRHAGVAASHNKVARPTGAGGYLCYELRSTHENDVSNDRRRCTDSKAAVPRRPGGFASVSRIPCAAEDLVLEQKLSKEVASLVGLKLWILSHTTVTNTPYLSVVIEKPSCALSRDEICSRLEKDVVKERTILHVDRCMVIELWFDPQPRVMVRLHPSIAKAAMPDVAGAFLMRELPQRLEDGRSTLSTKRRLLSIVMQNKSRSTLTMLIRSVQCLTGVPGVTLAGFTMPSVIASGQAAVTFFTNADFSLDGAEAVLMVEVVMDNKKSAGDVTGTAVTTASVWTGRLHASLNALGQCKVSCLFAPGTCRDFPLPALHPKPTSVTSGKRFAVPSLLDAETGEPLSILTSTLLVDGVNDIVEWVVGDSKDTVELLCTATAHRMTMTIGVCGFMEILDPRRLLHDQQVALWQPVLRTHPLFEHSHGLVAVWEEEYLQRFSKTVGLLRSETLVNRATQEVVASSKKHVKQQLLQGAIFAGLRALDTFKGTFAMPLYAVMAADLIDNTYATLTNRADFAGKDLAAAILSQDRGTRPVSLVGFSFGAAVIGHCLHELHAVGAFGAIENIFILGGVMPADRLLWHEIRRVAAGRVVNIYTRSDWLLWAMHKANDMQLLKPLAGLTPIRGVVGVENIDASALTDSHASYAVKLDAILSLIPSDFATCRTLHPCDSDGSPGALVPVGEIDITCQRLYSTMTVPILKEDHVCVVGVVNRVDGQGSFNDDMELVGYRLSPWCTFDFNPVDRIPTGHGGLCGVMPATSSVHAAPAEEGDQPEAGEESGVSGVVGYAINLQPLHNTVVLVLTFFCWDKAAKSTKSNAVAFSVPLEGDEIKDAALWKKRLLNVVEHHGASSNEVTRIACEYEPSCVTSSFGDAWDGKSQDGKSQDGKSQEALGRVSYRFSVFCGDTAAVASPHTTAVNHEEDWQLRLKLEDTSGAWTTVIENGTLPQHLLTQFVLDAAQKSSCVASDDDGVHDGAWSHVRNSAPDIISIEAMPESAESVIHSCLEHYPSVELLWGCSEVFPPPLAGPSNDSTTTAPPTVVAVLVPLILVNTSPAALTLMSADRLVASVDAETCSPTPLGAMPSWIRDAFWIRPPPGVLPSESAAVCVMRLSLSMKPCGGAAVGATPIFLCFASDDLVFHVLLKCEPLIAAGDDCSSATRFRLKVECAEQSDTTATTSSPSAILTRNTILNHRVQVVYFTSIHSCGCTVEQLKRPAEGGAASESSENATHQGTPFGIESHDWIHFI